MPVVGGYEGMMESQKHDMGQLLSAIGGAGKLQDMELHSDRARLLRAQAGLAENELTQEQAFAQAMSGMGAQAGMPEGPVGAPVSRAAPLFKMADIAFRAGAVKKGQDLLAKGSTIEHQEQQDIRSRETLAYYRRKESQEQLDRLGGFYTGVRSQADLDAANAAFKAVYPQAEVPHWATAPYSPYLIRGFQDSLLTAKERLAREQKDEDQAARDTRLDFDREREKRIADAQRVEADRKREADAAKAKAGAGKVSLNSGRDLPKLAAREISDAIFDGQIPPEFRKEVEGAVPVIAARAKYLLERPEGKGLDMAAAVARAVQESREQNEWTAAEIERPTKTFGFQTGTDKVAGQKFRARDAEPTQEVKQRMANLWGARRPATATTKFTDGQVYETPKGNLMFSGGKFYTQEEWIRKGGQ